MTARFRALRGAERGLQAASGFTLIELLLALTLGALTVLLAHRLFTAVADGAHRLSEARQALDREANARRWLAAAFGSLDVASPGGSFAGYADHVEFASWQPAPEGWLTRQRVTLARRGDRFIAAVGAGDSLALRDSVADVRFDYLLDPGNGQAEAAGDLPGASARFVREWISPVSAPLAVRVRLVHGVGKADTLLLIVGPRG